MHAHGSTVGASESHYFPFTSCVSSDHIFKMVVLLIVYSSVKIAQLGVNGG